MQAQEAQIRAFSEAAGFNVVRKFCDTGSGAGEGSISKRSDLREALALAKKTGWAIVVASLDRLSRNTSDVEMLFDRAGLKVISAKNGVGIDPLVLRGEAVRAEKERDMISERTKEALLRKKQEGVVLGNPVNLPEAQARGAATNKRRAAQRAEAIEPVLDQIMKNGGETASEIARALNERGFRTARGLPWNKSNIRRLLSRVKKPEWNPGAHSDHENPLWGSF